MPSQFLIYLFCFLLFFVFADCLSLGSGVEGKVVEDGLGSSAICLFLGSVVEGRVVEDDLDSFAACSYLHSWQIRVLPGS